MAPRPAPASKAEAVPRGGRPRSPETDRAIHEAALRLLREEGPGAVNVEAVAKLSGVAKTTIYRRYDHRDDLLRAVLTDLIDAPGAPSGNTAEEKIRWALELTWRHMADVLGPGGLAAVISGSDPSFTELFRSVLTPSTDALVELIRADVSAGVLRSDLDADAAVSLFVGAYLGELLRRGAVDDEFTARCLDLMWVAMTGGRAGH